MGWSWFTCPMYDGCPYTREHQSLTCNEKKPVSGGGLMTFHAASSLCRRGHLLQFHAPPPKSLLPTYPLIFLFPFQASAFTSTRSPGFKFTAPIFLSCSTVSVCMLLHCQLGLHLPQGSPQSIPYASYVHVHTCLAEASLMGASLLPMVGKTRSTRSLGLHPNIK